MITEAKNWSALIKVPAVVLEFEFLAVAESG
jgi:hypothetical protein